MTSKIGVVFITYRAKHHLSKCLPPFLNSPLKPRVLVVNSTSNDGTVELAQEMGAEVLVVPRSEFNHGTTREKARKFLQTDIVVMATPDAYALDGQVLEKLVDPLLKNQASVSYARQIAHDGADFFETFPREFNYPPKSEIRNIDYLSSHGVYTFFCSNACAAYKNAALDEVGGFDPVLFGEDTVAVSKLLRCGHQIAYVAEAIVKHSHRYTLKHEFKRHFDIGLSRKSYGKLLQGAGKDTSRGATYAKELLRKTFQEKPHLLPYACLQTAIKLIGYKIGQYSLNAPHWLKKKLSSQDFYWENLRL